MAVGLNHYFKNYCDVTVSWFAYDPVQYPARMPQVDELVRVIARAKERFFLNYCTFGYTMPWRPVSHNFGLTDGLMMPTLDAFVEDMPMTGFS